IMKRIYTTISGSRMAHSLTCPAIAMLLLCACGKGADQSAPSGDGALEDNVQAVGHSQIKQSALAYNWEHLSSVDGDLPVPNEGNQQTASLVMDVDKDGINDFIITERTKAPSVVWYRRNDSGWDRYVIEHEALTIEAGSTFADIDGDGDTDIVFGGD